MLWRGKINNRSCENRRPIQINLIRIRRLRKLCQLRKQRFWHKESVLIFFKGRHPHRKEGLAWLSLFFNFWWCRLLAFFCLSACLRARVCKCVYVCARQCHAYLRMRWALRLSSCLGLEFFADIPKQLYMTPTSTLAQSPNVTVCHQSNNYKEKNILTQKPCVVWHSELSLHMTGTHIATYTLCHKYRENTAQIKKN